MKIHLLRQKFVWPVHIPLIFVASGSTSAFLLSSSLNLKIDGSVTKGTTDNPCVEEIGPSISQETKKKSRTHDNNLRNQHFDGDDAAMVGDGGVNVETQNEFRSIGNGFKTDEDDVTDLPCTDILSTVVSSVS